MRTIALIEAASCCRKLGKKFILGGLINRIFFFLEEALALKKLVFLKEETPVGEEIDDADRAVMEVWVVLVLLGFDGGGHSW